MSDAPWWRPAAVGATNIPVTIAAGVLNPGHRPTVPEGVAPPTGVEPYLPGVITGGYAGVHGIGKILDQVSGGRIGYSLPGGDRSQELYDMTEHSAAGLVPHVEATPGNRNEEFMQTVGRGAGSMVIGSPVAKLPHALGLGAGVAGGLHVANEAMDAKQDNKPEVVDVPDVVDIPSGSSTPVAPQPKQAAPTDIMQKVDHYADMHNVPRALAHSFIGQESSYNPNAVNKITGAKGLGQLMDITAKELGVTDPFNADQNLDASMRYIRRGMDREGTVQGAARYYYGGPKTAMWGDNTEAYAQQIAARYNQNLQSMPAESVDIPESVDVPAAPYGWSSFYEDTVEVAKATALLGAVVIGGPKLARGFANAMRERLYAKAADAHTAQQTARAAGDVSSIDAPSVAAPLPGQTMGGIKAAVQDANDPLVRMVKEIDDNPTTAAQMVNRIHLDRNNLSVDQKAASFMESGHDPITGIDMPSMRRFWEKTNALTEEESTAYVRKRYIENELDNRERNFETALKKGSSSDPEYRTAFPHLDSTALRAEVARADAMPAVKQLGHEATVINQRYMDWTEKMGFTTAADIAAVKSAHPSYLPSSDNKGRILGAWEIRNTTPHSGLDSIMIHPNELEKQKYYQLYKQVVDNKFKTDMVDLVYRWQAKNPKEPKILEPHVGPPSGQVPGDWISSDQAKDVLYLRRNGDPQYHKVNNPQFHALMQEDQFAAHVFMTALNRSKNAYQYWTTGAGALLMGSAFMLKAFTYNMFTTAAIRPAKTSSGFIDAGVRGLTGGRVGLPGDVVGTGASMSYAIVADAMAQGAKVIGHMLQADAPTAANRVLRGILGDSVINAISTKMQYVWNQSMLHERRALGYSNVGGEGTKELTLNKVGATGDKLYNPANAWDDSKLTSIPVLRQGQRLLVNFKHIAETLHEIISDSASSSFYRLNNGEMPGMRWAKSSLDKETIGVMSRQLQGDAGVRGGSAKVRALTGALPYSNIAIQDANRLGSAFNNNPGGTIMGLTMALGTAAAASLLSALEYGPEALEHLENEISRGNQSGGIQLYMPGVSVDQRVVLPISQRERPFYPVIQAGVHGVLDTIHAFQDGTNLDTIKETLMDMLGRYMTVDTLEKSVAGASSMLSPSVAPALDALVGATTGKHLTMDLERIGGDAVPGMTPNARPMQDRLSTPLGGGNPGGPDTVRGGDSAGSGTPIVLMRHLLSSMLGVGGAFMSKAMESVFDQSKAGKTPADIVSSLPGLWAQGFMDNTPQGNMIWGNRIALTKNTPVADDVHNKLNFLRPLQSAMSDATNGTLTRADGVERPVPGHESKLPTDPIMFLIYQGLAGQMQSSINAYFVPRMHDTEKLLYDNDHSGLSPETVRVRHNEISRQYNQQMKELQSALDSMMDQRTEYLKQFGATKPFRIETVDWSKGVEQFR